MAIIFVSIQNPIFVFPSKCDPQRGNMFTYCCCVWENESILASIRAGIDTKRLLGALMARNKCDSFFTPKISTWIHIWELYFSPCLGWMVTDFLIPSRRCDLPCGAYSFFKVFAFVTLFLKAILSVRAYGDNGESYCWKNSKSDFALKWN